MWWSPPARHRCRAGSRSGGRAMPGCRAGGGSVTGISVSGRASRRCASGTSGKKHAPRGKRGPARSWPPSGSACPLPRRARTAHKPGGTDDRRVEEGRGDARKMTGTCCPRALQALSSARGDAALVKKSPSRSSTSRSGRAGCHLQQAPGQGRCRRAVHLTGHGDGRHHPVPADRLALAGLRRGHGAQHQGQLLAQLVDLGRERRVRRELAATKVVGMRLTSWRVGC